jgi:SAM-dependent methyltransferase
MFEEKFFTVLREHQYAELSKLTLNGSILDIGGSRKTGYVELLKGEHVWTVANYGDQHPGADIFFNAEEKFPLDNASFDNVTMINVIEHIFDTNNVFSEVARVLKPGGLFVATMPFMHHIHGSPDDFVRYTESAYKKFAQNNDLEIVYFEPLGYGFFSLVFQNLTILRVLPWSFLYNFVKFICTSFDKLLLNFGAYKRLANTIPLGYFWIMRKR